LIAKFVREEKVLAHALGNVHARFNPIRRYFQLQHHHHHHAHH
jgi:hypothetical protein